MRRCSPLSIGGFTNERGLLPERLEWVKQVVKGHYGVFWNREGELRYVIPQDINQVRPNIDRISDEDVFGETRLDEERDKAFLALVKETHPEFTMAAIEGALRACKHSHRHQQRKTGEPFYTHPLEVATILLPCTEDENVIIAALLHDVVEDTAFSSQQVALLFGSRVALAPKAPYVAPRLGMVRRCAG